MTPEPAISRPAAFLDRDGTIIEEREYLSDPDGVELIPGAINGIQLLNQWGYWVFGVSNQSGVGRGYFDRDAVDAVNVRIIERFADEKAFINRIYYCPHQPSSDGSGSVCDCRKPSPGLIHQAMHDYPVDLSRSFVAGDRQSDIDLGRGVGIPTALVLTGYGREQQRQLPESNGPDLVGDNLLTVVEQIGKMFGLSGASNI
ncbi:MAG: HAD-IIIA family hydrolase [candidate division Zixibacteria bacterium]|nr:HAD-IIIA family hydrolase [candidate division Zixibacteria bacterium]